jgi:hypothetical protein
MFILIILEDPGTVLMLAMNPVNLALVQIDLHVQFMTVIYVKIFILDILNAVNVYRP